MTFINFLLVAVAVVSWVMTLYALRHQSANRSVIMSLSAAAQREHADYTQIVDLLTAELRRSAALAGQVQDLSQRLATVRIERGAVSDEAAYVPPPAPPEPLSPGIRDFLDRIEHREARAMLEADIEFYRAQNMSDADILREIQNG